LSNAIEIEDVSKLYRLGEIGTGTLSRDLHRWVARRMGKEDPFLRIGETNDRTQKGAGDVVYSLRDVSFTVGRGDTVGIIGRNGAGKSTLLKILSRVTSPTTGEVRVRGRIASLLEVGTGFHPELTGRENIYLNGAILGMRKREIASKFDEIVDFSGVERYIDTPVKRYSSGMYVRLAFAVAAHLESEILIVDEVLAVGDVEFQQKCLGKMGEVSRGDGRTILFVSHNMAAVSTLCRHAVIMDKGRVDFIGDVNLGIERYVRSSKSATGQVDLEGLKHHVCVFSRLKSVQLLDEQGVITSTLFIGKPFVLRIGFELKEDVRNLELGFCINNIQGLTLVGYVSPWEGFRTQFESGSHEIECRVPFLQTLPGTYSVTVWIKRMGERIDDEVERAIEFEVLSRDLNGHPTYFDKYASELNMFQHSEWRMSQQPSQP
jgi:lipopolysaccharide transport system ATP-binding protein